jgi:hypothetical protein
MTANENAEQTGNNLAGSTAEDKSIWSIIVGVFTGPTEAFAAFNRKPRIIAVLIIAIILGFIGNYFMTEYSAKMQYDLVSKSSTIPPQQLEQMRGDVENPDRLMGGIFAVVGQIIGGLIIALIAWGIGSFVMGGDSTFKKVWGVTLLGGLIPLIGILVKLPLVIAKDSIYVSLGPAALFPDKDFTSIFYGILSFFDIFMIWSMIVTGIGFAAIFNISRGKGIGIALILDILFIGVMMGLMAFGLGFAGVEISFF